jgi:DNA repair protein RecN (Recombination protein N)
MLRTLRVRDLAIIEELELVLEPGLNVVTGETGAGKSILLQALDVSLGGRPDADLVRTNADEAVVEALFAGIPPTVQAALRTAGIPSHDRHDELVLRRVIARGGRTRAYVNGAQGSLALLRDLAPHLLRVYGQDEHQALRRVESHREMLDATGGLGGVLEEMKRRYDRLVAAREGVAAAKAAAEAVHERRELLEFQAEELGRANLAVGEDEALIAERGRLVHAERLVGLAGGAEAGLYSGEGSAVEAVGRALGALREAERLDASLAPTRALVETALAELEDAGRTLGGYAGRLHPDPERLEVVEERLAVLARLKRKYGGTIEELIQRRNDLTVELEAVAVGGAAIKAAEREVVAAKRHAAEWAGRLSIERRRVAHELQKALAAELRALALPDARFSARFAETGDERPIGPAGWDEVEFHISTNKGEEERSLAKVASGGELSRIMLALKTLAAADEKDAALIFDEVDAGIGGAVAEVVGRKLKQLGRSRQVLCITHLPLIAAYADHHIVVAKREEDGRTVSSARPLAPNERVVELARMLGGSRQTPEVRQHAEQLLAEAKGRRSAEVRP